MLPCMGPGGAAEDPLCDDDWPPMLRPMTATAGRCCPAALVARWGRLLPGLLLLLALDTSALAQAGVNVTPSSIDFGSRMVNGPSADRQVQIQNLTLGPVLISSIQITGAD